MSMMYNTAKKREAFPLSFAGVPLFFCFPIYLWFMFFQTKAQGGACRL